MKYIPFSTSNPWISSMYVVQVHLYFYWYFYYNQRLLTSFFRYKKQTAVFHELKISFQNTGILSIQFSRGGGGWSYHHNYQIPTLCLIHDQISLMILRYFVSTVYRFPWLTILYNIGLNPVSGKGCFFCISYKRFSCLFLITIYS